MSLDPTTPRSRRTLLTAAAAATAAAVAEAVMKPLPVAATTDDGAIIHVGDDYQAVTATTKLKNSTSVQNVLRLESTGGVALWAESDGDSTIVGATGNGGGVEGLAGAGTGVRGTSFSGTGVHGFSETGTGVLGFSSDNGMGVQGVSPLGIGVYAASNTGKALVVDGRAQFLRSGKAVITAGHRSVTVTVPGGLPGASLCFATLRTYRAGYAVAAVRPNYPSAGKIRIYLTKTVTAATTVSWLVLD